MSQYETDGQYGNDEPVREVNQIDYFAFNITEQFYLADGVSYVELAALNEGSKRSYQRRTQTDLVLERGSGNARMKIDQGRAREELLKEAIKGWNFIRGDRGPVAFNDRNLADFLRLANPSVVEDIEKRVREMNPWLLDDLTVEAIDQQIEELQERRKEVAERNEEKAGSSSK